MMNRAEIQKFFLLENDPQLFKTAIQPKSCGGGAKFKQLALFGDQVINIHLYNYLISKGWESSGDITKCKETIHYWTVIKAFADEFLGISDILTPVDANHQPQDKELAETVEALIGSTFQINGLERCRGIIYSLVEFAIERQKKLREQGEFDESQNYFGMLAESFKNPRLSKSIVDLKKSDIEPTRKECEDGSHTYRFEGDITFNEIKCNISTYHWPQKDKARNEAAYIALCSIAGNNPKYRELDPTIRIQTSKEKTVHPTTSIDDEELIFRKPVSNNESMEVNQNTGELLVDWVNRKAQKNVFRMLTLLSARLDTVSGASWTCDTSSGVLALINLQLGEEMFFAMGLGISKTKAREAAGEDMWMKVDLIEWLEKHYPNYTI